MRKYFYLVVGLIVTVGLLLFFYDERVKVLNREYVDDGIYVEYPYFGNRVIDDYISKYLDDIIVTSLDYELFIDYDYEMFDGGVNLYFYVNKELNSVFKREEFKFRVLFDSGSIYRVDDVSLKDNYFDLYNYEVIDKDKPMIAITFDDGPSYNTNRVLSILDKYNVKATFFVLGMNIKGNEGIIKKMDDLGMEIGSHMYSHKLATRLSDEDISWEVSKVEELVFDVIGKVPTFVRPSYGSFNSRVKNAIDRPIIIWNIDTLDWKYHNSKKISDKILNNVKDGDIVLMHDIYSATANSLSIVIPKLLERGYQLVSVSELFYYKNIEFHKGEVYGYLK